MTLQILALIIVVVGFITLLVYIFSPSNKDYFAAMSRLPFDTEKETRTPDCRDGKE
ncbi:MAG: cbb3-type cytochrome c oxidase subunit 3 [Chromatocurvus sp.]